MHGAGQPPQTIDLPFDFQYISSNEETSLEAEILLYDMNGDGQQEILVALSDRKRIEARTYTYSLINFQAVYCVGYAPGEGFWQADSVFEVREEDGDIRLNFFEERDLSTNFEWTVATLEGRKFRFYTK